MKNLIVLAFAVGSITAYGQVDPNGVSIDGNNCGKIKIKNAGSGINGSYFDDVYDSNIGSFNGNSTLTGDISNRNTNRNTNQVVSTNNNVNNNVNNNTSTSRGGNSRNNVSVDASQDALQLDVLSQRMVGASSLLFSAGSTYNNIGQGTLAFARASAVRKDTYNRFKVGTITTILNGQGQTQLTPKQQRLVNRVIAKGGKTERLEFGFKSVWFTGKHRYDLIVDVNPARIGESSRQPAFWLTKTLIK